MTLLSSLPNRLGFLLVGAVLLATGCGDDEVGVVDREAPPNPSGVYSITGNGSVEVHWSPLVGADVAGYTVYAARDPDSVGMFPIGQVFGEEADTFVDSGIPNGVTWYYGVTAFDHDGNESGFQGEEYVGEVVHDTPRPSGAGLTLYSPGERFSESAVDWSEYAGGRDGLAVPFDDSQADFIILDDEKSDLLFLQGTTISVGDSAFENDIQDFGFTQSLDEVDWAPSEGWARAPVELIAGHAYIVWTWDDYYAKFRVSGLTATSATLEWAYQATDDYPNRFELKARPVRASR